MKLIKFEDQKIIDSQTCGKLLEVINSKESPVSITVADCIKPTKPHFHQISTELYWVLKGTVEVNNSVLNSGDLLIINPGEKHAVTKASKTNKVVVISYPTWSPSDEYL